jgi:hypothetical protein
MLERSIRHAWKAVRCTNLETYQSIFSTALSTTSRPSDVSRCCPVSDGVCRGSTLVRAGAQFPTTNPSAFLTCDLLDIGPSPVQFSPDRTPLSLLLISLIGSVAVIESVAKVSRGGSPRAAQSLPASRSWRPPTLTVPPRTHGQAPFGYTKDNLRSRSTQTWSRAVVLRRLERLEDSR